MSDQADDRTLAASRADQLKQAFDQAFADAPQAAEAAQHDLLAIRIAATHCALRLADIRGIFRDRKIVPVPARGGDLLGLASFRGAIIPVFGLAALLGLPGDTRPRWLAVAADGNIALAFDDLEDHLRVAQDAIESGAIGKRAGERGGQKHIAGYLRVDDVLRGVVDVASIVAATVTKAVKS